MSVWEWQEIQALLWQIKWRSLLILYKFRMGMDYHVVCLIELDEVQKVGRLISLSIVPVEFFIASRIAFCYVLICRKQA